MMSLQPFQGIFDGVRCLIMGYTPEDDRLLIYTATGEIMRPLRETVTVEWHYSDEAQAWMNFRAEMDAALAERLDIAARGLEAIANYTHQPNCPNKDEFEVWDCNCTTLKPDLMARLTLESMELENEDEDVPVSGVQDEDPA